MPKQQSVQCETTMEVPDPSKLNNQGISCLLEGRNQDAVQCFKDSLIAMKASLYRVPTHLQLPPSRMLSTPLYGSINIPHRSEEKFSVYICAHAVEFPSTAGAIEDRDYPFYCALVMFNIGLAYNLRCQTGVVDELSLKEAAYFYSISLKVLNSLKAHCKRSSLAAINLAVLNNLATVRYEQGNANIAYQTLGQAYAILSSSELFSLEDAEEAGFNQGDFDGISLNAVVMKMTFAAPCA